MRKSVSDEKREEREPRPFMPMQPSGDGLFFLRMADLKARTRLSQSTIYDLMNAGKFPKPYRLTERCIGWLESEVNAWLLARVEQGPAIPSGALTQLTDEAIEARTRKSQEARKRKRRAA